MSTIYTIFIFFLDDWKTNKSSAAFPEIVKKKKQHCNKFKLQ